MEELQDILSSHHSKHGAGESEQHKPSKLAAAPTSSKIPDLFFDEVLIQFKLTRLEVLVLMYLYRLTWCKPNLNKKFGIAPMISYEAVSGLLGADIEHFYQTIRILEGYGFIETIRSGQYFVRKYFTEDNDQKYGLSYENFL